MWGGKVAGEWEEVQRDKEGGRGEGREAGGEGRWQSEVRGGSDGEGGTRLRDTWGG